jgi:integrase
MGDLTDPAIRGLLKSGKPFEITDGDGLTLRLREGAKTPVWRLRYRIGGEPRVVVLGSLKDKSLSQARTTAKEHRARITLGHDVAAEKRERKREAVAKIEAARSVRTVGQLADEYFKHNILPAPGRKGWKHPGIVRARIEKDIRPNLGKRALAEVTPDHIDKMLKGVVARGAPTIANDVLRWTRRMFNYAMKRRWVNGNPAATFDLSDAGGSEEARTRALSRDEVTKLFEAMRKTPGFSVENFHTFKLLLLLAVRKSELTNAKVAEFDLDKAVWALPAERTKTNVGIDIPLPPSAVEALRELVRLGEGSDYLLPARKMQERMLPHINESTLGVALSKVRQKMPGVERFTIHDFRRTARTQLSALGVSPHVAEKCLNHALKGVEGTYDRHAYFDERRSALIRWAEVVDHCERGNSEPTTTPKAKRRKVKARGLPVR